jgi:hypothetical protein
MTGRGTCQIRPRSPSGAVSRAMANPCAGRSLSIARTVSSASDSDGSAIMILSVVRSATTVTWVATTVTWVATTVAAGRHATA